MKRMMMEMMILQDATLELVAKHDLLSILFDELVQMLALMRSHLHIDDSGVRQEATDSLVGVPFPFSHPLAFFVVPSLAWRHGQSTLHGVSPPPTFCPLSSPLCCFGKPWKVDLLCCSLRPNPCLSHPSLHWSGEYGRFPTPVTPPLPSYIFPALV